MPSKTPIFPLRLRPDIRARLEAILGPYTSLNGSINGILAEWLEYHEMQRVEEKLRASPALDPQPSRNAMCSCGSGKKFKRCCGR